MRSDIVSFYWRESLNMKKTTFNRKPLYAALVGSAVAMATAATPASAGFVNPEALKQPLMLAGKVNPCNPCAAKHMKNPCNPCGPKIHMKNPCNPCNPCAAKKNPCNPCNPCAAKRMKNPCNPCAAKKKSTSG